MTMYPPPPEAAGPPPTEMGGPSGPRAGFWRRFAGLLIDGILLSIVTGIVSRAIHGATGSLLGFVIDAAYFTILIGASRGQTLGQMALGIRVIDFNTGGPIGYGRAFIRWIVSIISTIVIFLGYLWMLWDPQKQTWHDKAAASVPIRVKT